VEPFSTFLFSFYSSILSFIIGYVITYYLTFIFSNYFLFDFFINCQFWIHTCISFVFAGRKNSSLTKRLIDERGILPFSYLPTSVKNGTKRQSKNGASFNNHWYAIAYPWQIGTDDVFATRLWGEPLVLYRDEDSNLVCAKDSCPHRSAPLSLSKMNNERRLECM